MIICGLKLTHDGGVALIDNGELKFSIEIEKINNNPRYSAIKDLSVIQEILEDNHYSIDQVDQFVIDGWHGSGLFWKGVPMLPVVDEGKDLSLEVAPYNESNLKENVLTRYEFKQALPIRGKLYDYASYMHVAGHITSAYCTSPFAARNESSYILTWDGGQYPRLYYFDVRTREVRNLGHLFLFLGGIYSTFAQYFGPYKKTVAELEDDRKKKEIEGFFGGYSVAGKIMSYIALGTVREELLSVFEKVRKETIEISNEFSHIFSSKIRNIISPEIYPDEDVLATLHVYLERLLLEHLRKKIEKYPYPEKNLCFSGGCALNIKWNSAIRNSGMFNEVYVPPFPNDSGSAIGAACSEFLIRTTQNAVAWNVYSGPVVRSNEPVEGWVQSPCSVKQLAHNLYESGEPVVLLNGAAELGPRALGNRSIIASPVHPRMKDVLNRVKKREPFRPVAPICLEEEASAIFDPGCEDPYMLFDHQVRTTWKERVPAICHLDGTARLQTVNAQNNSLIYELLQAFKAVSGLPLLCNTSANLNGSGFFPDVASATLWGQVNYVWCNNILYTKVTRNQFGEILADQVSDVAK
ncbi:nodulation protein NodU [Chitinophaga pendula]|uniref:carbamoyltransferase N-terminal domain-containing protein n=1 Tax=Chitinophaga TaxID=79328 RepID=UPI000BAFFC04|nr:MULTISPECIES: carbamoyltransferase N-terminal domain-containing protein [Chitinophaga]ASZ12159.1 hypothetical protein CK934_14915 [Chitinophaga sp. MD30]UCJ04805.1 nodulation protein NodU [Chitinophaga pendula]